jgi:hypothetical protein
MSIINNIQRGRTPRPQRVVIYAPEGFGKSTLASQFPEPLFIDIEGSTSQMEVARLTREQVPDLKAVEMALTEVAKERPCRTLVIDTIDWLELMVTDAVIKEAASDKIQGIEDFGYGKGYVMLKERMTVLLAKLDSVIAAGIHVVLLAHSQVRKFEPPDGAGPFDRYELKLSKQVAPLVKEWADMLLFGNWKLQVRERDKHEAGAQFKAVGGRERLMHCNRAAAWDAKNRHGLGDAEKWDVATIQRAFTAVGLNSAAPAAEKPATPGLSVVKPSPSTPSPAPSPGGSEIERLAVAIAGHEDAATDWLINNNHIKVGDTWRDMSPSLRGRALKNPTGFIKTILTHKEGVAA